jgi:hypothetical protein
MKSKQCKVATFIFKYVPDAYEKSFIRKIQEWDGDINYMSAFYDYDVLFMLYKESRED